MHGLSGNVFSDLLCVFRKLLPDPNELEEKTYVAKQMICLISLKVEKIHECSNDSILYRRDKYKDYV
jgi:hypothetical protein